MANGFIDKARITVRAGNGGNGGVAFHREKYVAAGGPDGGDGGRGGSIILQVDDNMSTLMDFRYKRKYVAGNGVDGQGGRKTGKDGESLTIKVPRGTLVRDAESGEIIKDMSDDAPFVLCKGGRGGWGNQHFATPTRQVPRFAKAGLPGESHDVFLELKLLADVGLVGFPNVGKSTLVSVVSEAKPVIADYHFTTLVPNLGMVRLDDGRDFVMADLPGLIEGASQGVGLGIQFLRHVERTRVILHLIDMSGVEGRDPFDDYKKINAELAMYDPLLLERPQIVVASKMDMPDSSDNLETFRAKLENDDTLKHIPEVMAISSLTHQGLDALMQRTANILEETPAFATLTDRIQEKKRAEYGFEADDDKPFTLTRDSDAVWILSGEKLEKLFKMTNLEHDESMMRFARQLRGMGVDDELRARGAKNGDLVRIGDFTFEFVE